MDRQSLSEIIDVDAVIRKVSATLAESNVAELAPGVPFGVKTYEIPGASICAIGNVVPCDTSALREEQLASVLEQVSDALKGQGMDFGHVMRTWFYLDDILSWYDVFNHVRSAFFREHARFENGMPASTGVGMANRFGAQVLAGALAIKPHDETVHVSAVPSPLQCPALDYKSSFSRAIEVTRPGRRELYISGTASIAADGGSLHRDSIAEQINLSMEVTHAILASRDMGWQDCTRAIAYFKDGADEPAFRDYMRRHGLDRLPVECVQGEICREELLFEIELDASRRMTRADQAVSM